MIKIAVIGAGSTYTPELVDGLLKRRGSFPVTELWLMDIDARKLRIVGALARRMVERGALGLTVHLTENLDEALMGAKFVFAQIRVGRLPARHLDESIPPTFGFIGQETTGIGGFFKGLRTIPVMLDIARRMELLCPDAWLINFSNPSGMVAEALQRHSSTRSIGLCNAPIGMTSAARNAVSDLNADITYVGLNHLAFITSVISHGEEKLPELLAKGFAGQRPANIPDTLFDAEYLQLMGGIPSGYLVYYADRIARLEKMKTAEKTRAQICMDIEEELLALYSDEGLYEKPALLDKRGGHMYSEAAVSLADDLYNNAGTTHIVNVRNNGVLPYLEVGEVAEIACRVTKYGVQPIPVDKTGTPYMIDIIRTVKRYERLAVDAAITGDREIALAAILQHPLVGDYTAGKACFDALLQAHRDYLPQFFGGS